MIIVNAILAQAEDAQKIVDASKENYNRLREDLATKVVLLNEKRLTTLYLFY